MFTENDIELAVKELLVAEEQLQGFTIEATVEAMAPHYREINNANKGTILISVSGEYFNLAKLRASQVNKEVRLTVALGTRQLRNNSQLWDAKNVIMKALTWQKPIEQMSYIYPISVTPNAEQVEGIYWLRMEFMMRNYLGVN